jgi:hypothetical protein
MKRILLLLFVLIYVSCFAQHDDYWLLKENKKGETGYVDSQGKVKIAYGTYQQCFTDTFRRIAFVAVKDSGIIAIDKEGKQLFRVFNYDNGPDDLSEGLFRIVRGHKVGFADRNGTVKIPAMFEMAYPFSNGMAMVKGGCNAKGDSCKVGYINRMGMIVINMAYDDGESFEKGKAKVVLRKEEYYIDKKGQRIQ